MKSSNYQNIVHMESRKRNRNLPVIDEDMLREAVGGQSAEGSMLEIDLSDEHMIYITMRSGVTFGLYGGANKLEEKIRSMASWFVSVEDYKTMRGYATISDANPERVTYTPSQRT